MFNFLKNIKDTLIKPKETVPSAEALRVSAEIKAEKKRLTQELLDGKDSYKIFYWVFIYKDGKGDTKRLIPLREWKDVEDILDRLEREYDRIETGRLLIEIKDSHPNRADDEIASLQIQIAHGYMRPYLKYREDGKTYAEKWKIYFDINASPINSLEFDMEEVGMEELTQDISLVKTLFKEFYETGDVSEKYMH